MIQPYIHGISDLSFISRLNKIGVKHVACKGFTYEKANMKELVYSGMDENILNKYDNLGQEVLIGENYVKELVSLNNLEYVDLKEYVLRNVGDTYRLNYEDAIKSVDRVFSVLKSDITICSSSESLDEIRENAIKRRTF